MDGNLCTLWCCWTWAVMLLPSPSIPSKNFRELALAAGILYFAPGDQNPGWRLVGGQCLWFYLAADSGILLFLSGLWCQPTRFDSNNWVYFSLTHFFFSTVNHQDIKSLWGFPEQTIFFFFLIGFKELKYIQHPGQTIPSFPAAAHCSLCGQAIFFIDSLLKTSDCTATIQILYISTFLYCCSIEKRRARIRTNTRCEIKFFATMCACLYNYMCRDKNDVISLKSVAGRVTPWMSHSDVLSFNLLRIHFSASLFDASVRNTLWVPTVASLKPLAGTQTQMWLSTVRSLWTQCSLGRLLPAGSVMVGRELVEKWAQGTAVTAAVTTPPASHPFPGITFQKHCDL